MSQTKFKIIDHSDKILAEFASKNADRMNDAVNIVRNKVLVTLSGNRSGIEYFVPGTSKLYQASNPGEAPATATGALRQSIFGQTTKTGYKVIGKVGTDREYGKHLEYGTYRIAARPWLRVSAMAVWDKVKSALARRY